MKHAIRGRRAFRCRLALIALVLCAACRSLTPADRARVDRWLECDECTEGEFSRLQDLARFKRAPLIDTLGSDLLRGVPAPRLANIRAQFDDHYTALQDYQQSRGLTQSGISREQYVQHYADNFATTYRARAAIALARIGGARAMLVLDSALKDSLRPDLRRIVQTARTGVLR